MRCQRPVLNAITIAVACAWLATIAQGAHAQAPSAGDWPQFRGGPALGLVAEATLPLAWDKSPGSKGKIVWRSAIPGAGWSQPVSVDGRIYLTTAVIPGGRKPKGMTGGVMDLSTMGWGKPPKDPVQWRVLCLDATDGSLIWSKTVVEQAPKYATHASNTYATETPCATPDGVWAFFGATGTVVALDRDGNERWKREYGPQPITNAFGTGASPVLHDGKLLVQLYNDDAGDLNCLDAATGADLWTATRTKGASWATPIIWNNGGTTEVVTGGQGSIVAYALADGSERWRYGGLDTSFACSLGADAEGVYFGTSSPGSKAPAAAILAGASGDISPGKDGGTSATVPWNRNKSGAGMPSPVVVGDFLYFFGNTAVCYDKRTGEEKYRKRLPGGTQAVGCPIVVGERIYLVNELGKTIVLKTGPDYEVLAESDLGADGEVFWSTPAVAGDALLIRSSDAVYCIRGE
ncbi:MAG: PQQ-binding-like beta-propeller repeat protein [Planctomycetota bacterium]|nr:PQQ-binding-like beta-propeller repeat protein [Planctomycetota bacterium]